MRQIEVIGDQEQNLSSHVLDILWVLEMFGDFLSLPTRMVVVLFSSLT